jgi:hypothetical protein
VALIVEEILMLGKRGTREEREEKDCTTEASEGHGERGENWFGRSEAGTQDLPAAGRSALHLRWKREEIYLG